MKRRLAALAFGIAVPAVLLAALELGSRLVAPTAMPQPLIAGERDDWIDTRRWDPLLFWSLRPSVVVDGQPFTNALGLRVPEVGPKAEGELRILSLGESTTFGQGLAWHETYSGRLERLLEPSSAGNVRVVNAGVPGYTLFQGWLYLAHRGAALDPDAVLLYFGYNDFLPVAYRVKRDAAADAASTGLDDRELHERQQTLVFRARRFLLERSNLYRRIALGSAPATSADARAGDRPRVPAEDRWYALDRIHALCAERGMRMVVVLPWYLRFEEHEPLLRRFASERDVLLIDLPDLLRDLPRPRESYFTDPVHPTAEGHDLIARAIAAELARAWPVLRQRRSGR
jgi:lysophospholipase L1-like esterase